MIPPQTATDSDAGYVKGAQRTMFGIVVSIVFGFILLLGYVMSERKRRDNAVEKYAGSDPTLRNDIVNKIIRVGMPEQQVIDSWGSPSRRTVRQLKTKVKTTLHFGSYKRVYLDNGMVTGWHLPIK